MSAYKELADLIRDKPLDEYAKLRKPLTKMIIDHENRLRDGTNYPQLVSNSRRKES